MKELPVFNMKESIISSRRRLQHRLMRKNSSQESASSKSNGSRSVSRNKKNQQGEPYEQRHHKVITATFSLIVLVYLYTVFRTEALLEEFRLRGGGGGGSAEDTKENDDEIRRTTIHYDFDRFILFKHMKTGQGKTVHYNVDCIPGTRRFSLQKEVKPNIRFCLFVLDEHQGMATSCRDCWLHT
jgi:hypothetical protein